MRATSLIEYIGLPRTCATCSRRDMDMRKEEEAIFSRPKTLVSVGRSTQIRMTGHIPTIPWASSAAGAVSASLLSLSNGDMEFVPYSTLTACSVVGLWFRGGAGWRIKPSTAAKMRTRRTVPGMLAHGALKAQLEGAA